MPAARALERRLSNHVAVQIHVDRETVTAQRIHAFGLPIRVLDGSIVAGILDVIEDHFVV
jgi:hypothetical protein